MFSWLLAGFRKNPHIVQAREDQKWSDYPGCPEGMMKCRRLCHCLSSDRPSYAWIKARAEALEKMAGCQHEETRPFYTSMFPEFQCGIICENCDAVQRLPGQEWQPEN